MSTTVDERVVSMQFDNRHFESNVQTTMSTLDKLKQKLRLDGAAKGLESVNTAARKVNFSEMEYAATKAGFQVQDIWLKVASVLEYQVAGRIIAAGKRMTSALTIDPIKTGFQEYETQINAVQTILANTSSKGTTIDDVNRALEELNEYADKTIYNFTEMTRNIGTFTAAGVDLETATNAIQGIANLAAVSGSTSQQASTAMYQLSQALSSGTVKLMDWNSVVNAGMGGQVFQDALKETARVHGVAIDSMIEEQGSFRETLSEGWLTADILTETLQKFTLTTEGLTEEQIEANREMLRAKGYTEAQIDEIFKLGKTATDAATKVKTFTQLWDVMKESAQSGWAQTWKLIIGDFEEAKAFLTPLATFLTNVINKMSEARNAVLESALGQNFRGLGKVIRGIFDAINGPMTAVSDIISGVTRTLEEHEAVVNEVILGTWGNAQERWDSLTKSGYDWAYVQNRVNEKLGSSVRRATDYTGALAKQEETQADLNGTQAEQIAQLTKMDDAQLKALGLTDKQIEALRDLKTVADKLGVSVEFLMENIDDIDGRWMLLNSFKNIGKGLVDTFTAIKTAWQEIFPPKSTEEKAAALFNFLGAFHKLTTAFTGLVNSETGEVSETFEKIVRTFKGLFAAVDIVASILGGGLRIALNIIGKVLSYFHLDILDVTATIGDAIVKFRDWLDSLFDVSGILDVVVPLVEKAATAIRNWFAEFKASEGMQKAIQYIRDIGKGIKDWWSGLKDAENLPKTIAEGIVQFFSDIPKVISTVFKYIRSAFTSGFSGLGDSPIMGVFDKLKNGLKLAGQTVIELGKILLEKLNGFLSARGFKTISEDSIAGLVNGFKEGAVKVWNAAVEMAKSLVQRVKDFLGIHSPSKVFFAIGGFIIAGLIAGLQNGIPDSLGAIKDVFQPMLDWINGIDLGAVLAGVIGVGSMVTVYKAVDAIKAFSAPFKSLGGLLETADGILQGLEKPIKNVVNGFAKMEKAMAFNLRMEGVKTLAISIAILAASVAVLSFIKPAKLWNAVGVIAALAVIVGVLAFAMNKLNSASVGLGKDGLNIKGLSSGLAGIGIALLMLGLTVKMIGSLDPEQAKQGFLGLAGLVAAVAIVIATFGLLVKGKASDNMDKFGKTMTKLAIALLLMTLVIKMLGKMDQTTLIQGGLALIAFSGILVGLMAATKLISGSKNVDTIGKTLLKLALAIGVMAIVANLLGKMDRDTLIQGGLAIVAFGGILVGLMAATKLINGSKNVDSIGGTLLKMALAIGIMAVVVKLLGNMDRSELIQGGAAIVAFGGIIVGLMAATKLITGSKNVDKIGGAILGVAGAIAIMALTAFMLSMISWEGFAKGTTMVTVFAGIIVGLMAATKLVGNDADKISKTIITISAAIAALGLIAVLLSLVPTENLVKGLVAVTVLTVLMAGLVAVTKLAQNCMGTLIVLTVAIAVLAGALYLLSTIPSESLITPTIALGSLMVVMTGVLAILSLIGKVAKDALLGVLALTAMAVPLILFVGVLSMMQNVQNALSNVIALSILATAMTLLLIPLTIIGAAGMTGAPYLGVLALLTMAAPLLAFVGILSLMSGLQNGIANAEALAKLMTAIGDVLFKISLVAPLAVIGVGALSAMLGLMTALGIIATAIGALITQFPQLQTFLDIGIPILERLASGLGSIIGSFISGFAGEVMTILPMLGACLSQFMVNAMPFINGAKMVDESVLKGVGILAGAVLALTAADLITGVVSFLQGGSSFADLGTQLSQFMTNALPFITTAAMITPDMLSGVKALAETILILTAANVIDGLTSWFTGGSSLETFAAQLPILGQGLASFATNLGAFTDEQLTTVNCAAKAIKTLAQASNEIPNAGGLLGMLVGENDLGTFAAQFPILGSGLAQFLSNIGTFTDEQVATVNCAAEAIKTLASASSEIPNTGGLLGQLVGENDLGTFAAQFPILGSGLAQFLSNIGTFTDEQVATVDCAARAIKTLAQASSEIPNSGGWLGQIVGDNDLGTFADQFPVLGTGISDFLSNIGTFTDDQVATVSCAANAIKVLAQASSAIPNSGGLLAAIVGDNELGTFASQLPKVGEGIRGFADKLGTFTDGQVSTIYSGVTAITALTGLANADLKGATKHLTDFGNDLPDFAEDVVSFCTSMPSKESTSNAVNNLKKILSAVESIASANSGPLATFADNLKKIGKGAVDKFVEAFTSSSTKTDLKNAAKDLGTQVIDGIKAKESAIKTAGTNAAKKAVDGAKTQDDDMESAGKDLGKGLVNGIKAKWDAAYDAGYTLGQKAVQGEKDGQQSKSPSKLTMQAGNWLGDGLIIGIKQMGNKVYGAGRNLGAQATTSISSAISKVADMVNSDIDAQPTIRPVLDLSDVRSGIGAMGSMLDMGSSVGVMANVGAISTMMNTRGQNGVNDDVVSAIDKLRKDLGNVGSTNYTIGGITYDDGSNVSEAVRTLVRAATVERRV